MNCGRWAKLKIPIDVEEWRGSTLAVKAPHRPLKPSENAVWWIRD